jgi:hypothetical protein
MKKPLNPLLTIAVLLVLMVTTIQASFASGSSDDPKSCEEFITEYEKWIDVYVDLVIDYYRNPSDQALMTKYSEAAAEAAEWAQDWTNFYTCAQDEAYMERFQKIGERAERHINEAVGE